MAEFRKRGGFGGDKRPGGFRSGGDRPSFARKGGFGGGRGRDDSRPPQMFTATCANCGKSCEVPFRPSGDRPVFCKDCFGEKRDAPSGGFDRRSSTPARPFERREVASRTPTTSVPDARMGELIRSVEVIGKKLDAMVELLNTMTVAKGDAIQQVELAQVVKKIAKKKSVKK